MLFRSGFARQQTFTPDDSGQNLFVPQAVLQRQHDGPGPDQIGGGRHGANPVAQLVADAAVAPGVVPENQCLEAVYNGSLSFKTNTTVRLEDYPTNVFRTVPQTQNGAAAYPSQGLELVDLNTSFYMYGNTDNKFTLSIGDGDRAAIAGGAESKNFACLILAGFEVVEAAKSNLRIDELDQLVGR